jgi:hypothetical protein
MHVVSDLCRRRLEIATIPEMVLLGRIRSRGLIAHSCEKRLVNEDDVRNSL